MTRKIKLSFFSFAIAAVGAVNAQTPQVGQPLPAWSDGYLDIHAVNTGRGECSFIVMPDGTTMLLDAGEIHDSAPSLVPQKPNVNVAPYQAYIDYICHVKPSVQKDGLDYVVLTHFHEDHMGVMYKDCPMADNGAYALTGLMGIGDKIHFNKLIDRGWPDYKTPIVPTSKSFPNYMNFVNWQRENNGMAVEAFKVGTNKQIVLQNKPKKYPLFEIRNLVANGVVWTGIDTLTRNYFVPTEKLNKNEYPGENQVSIGMRITYGKFDYFTGGDLPCITKADWMNLEVPVGNACGPVDAMKANHHMNFDANGVAILQALRPRVIVGHVARAQQPDIQVLRRMLSPEKSYPGERDVFTTNLHDATPYVVYPHTQQIKAAKGHIVIRVSPGGDEYYVYAVNDESEKYEVTSIHGPYKSK